MTALPQRARHRPHLCTRVDEDCGQKSQRRCGPGAALASHRNGGSTPVAAKQNPPPHPLCDISSGCGFFTGPWTVTRCSLRAALGHCVLTAAAVCVPSGVVSALAGPSRWCTGTVLVVAGVVVRLLLSTPLHVQVVHHLLPHVAMCVRPNCSPLLRHGPSQGKRRSDGDAVPRVGHACGLGGLQPHHHSLEITSRHTAMHCTSGGASQAWQTPTIRCLG